MMVDTNVLLHAANLDSAAHCASRALIQALARGPRPWFLTWPIHYEFLRVATHPSVFATPLRLSDGLAFLWDLHRSRSLRVLVETDRHAEVLAKVAEGSPEVRGSALHDLHIVAVMVEHGVVEIATLDAGFRRFPQIRPVSPPRR